MSGGTSIDAAASGQRSAAASGRASNASQTTPVSLLDIVASMPVHSRAVDDSSTQADSEPVEFLPGWLAESDPVHAILMWLDQVNPHQRPTSAKAALRRLDRDVGQIDRMLNGQLNAVMHHPRFLKLESSWRGLRYLVDKTDPEANVKIRVLSLTWKALVRDLDRAIEFDQSQLFKKIYSEEFGTSGGEPFSVLIGDYEMHLRPSAAHKFDDLEALKSLTQVAAAAFTPFIASAHPSLFGLDSFQELERPSDIARVFEQPEYVKWNSLRRMPDSRFLALTLPRVLLRKPYDGRQQAGAKFPFRETMDATNEQHFLWGNGAYAIGGVIIRSFCQNGWLADIRGVRQDREEGGLITGLPEVSWKTDRPGTATKPPLDVVISEAMEADFSNLGFTAICPCDITGIPAIYSTPTLQKPDIYDDANATMSARLSTMLHYVLCISRIAHYIKVLGREKIGSYTEPSDCEEFLNDWLRKYVTQDDDAAPEVKARYPLREAEATIRERPNEPGNYYCTIYLQPHYQMDDMVSAVKLTTEISPARRR
ncbi:MAG: type VI secretion system contractile sheath large subunit [Planctomyces sp.]|nr:type VI secretion system contractile sheath large subunit [Planctomyces sp.]